MLHLQNEGNGLLLQISCGSAAFYKKILLNLMNLIHFLINFISLQGLTPRVYFYYLLHKSNLNRYNHAI